MGDLLNRLKNYKVEPEKCYFVKENDRVVLRTVMRDWDLEDVVTNLNSKKQD